jgi:hypothetical protein
MAVCDEAQVGDARANRIGIEELEERVEGEERRNRAPPGNGGVAAPTRLLPRVVTW